MASTKMTKKVLLRLSLSPSMIWHLSLEGCDKIGGAQALPRMFSAISRLMHLLFWLELLQLAKKGLSTDRVEFILRYLVKEGD